MDEGEVWLFINDNDNYIYTYAKDKGEIICGRYMSNVQFLDMIEDIEESKLY